MKKRLSNLLFLTISIFIILLFLFLYRCHEKDYLNFSALSENFFIDELENNSLSLHYTLANPENYDIDSKTISLPVYSSSSMKESNKVISSYLEQLSEIDAAKLDHKVAFQYELLQNYLILEKEALSFPFYSDPLSPSSGAQSQIPILLAEYQFRQKEDIQQYLSLLLLLPDYFAGLVHYEKQKSKEGLFMADFSLNKVISQCSIIMDFNSLQNDTHFLITSFADRLLPLQEDGVISEKEVAHYIEMNRDILIEKISPCYAMLADELLLLKSSGTNNNGLFYYPDGPDYYQNLIKQTVGTSKSIPQLKDLLIKQLELDQNHMNTLLKGKTILHQPELSITKDTAMMENLQERMKADFPPFPSNEKPSLELKTVSPYLANFVSPAFYLTPPVDDISTHVIYRNPAFPMNTLDLYTTLAHEGYPGHLYQSVFYLLENEPNSYNLAIHLLPYSGYAEGWAYYVENIAYSYAMELTDSKDIEIYRTNQNMKLAIYSLLDIFIHHDGYQLEDCAYILSNYGITDASVVKQIFEYIVEEPTTYLKYYVGYLEMLELQKKAQVLMGDTYSDLVFHQFILALGPAPFDMIQKEMQLEFASSNT